LFNYPQLISNTVFCVQVNAAQAMIMQKLMQHQQQHAANNMLRAAGGH
jgi:hypothetical protein